MLSTLGGFLAKSIANRLGELLRRYKLATILAVFIMTSYGLSALISGGAPTARLMPEEITIHREKPSISTHLRAREMN